jgi:hypothetical protein
MSHTCCNNAQTFATTHRELPIKQCREVRFSNGGQYFAAVNGNVITIYDFYTFERLADMRGHNGKVSCKLPLLEHVYSTSVFAVLWWACSCMTVVEH